jgi:hypothetical protein
VDTYRKPTSTDTTINFHSNHPIEQKMAVWQLISISVHLSVRYQLVHCTAAYTGKAIHKQNKLHFPWF